MGSLYSDWAQPLIDHQWGIAQGFLRFHWGADGPRARFAVDVKAGAFWDRLGWLQRYDTYLFGAHAPDGRPGAHRDAASRNWSFWLMQGFGAHLEALDQNEGLTLLNYLHAGARWRQNVEAGFYFLDTLSHDKRQLKEINDADMRVYGLDVRLTSQQARLAALRRRLQDRSVAGDLPRARDRGHARLRRPRPDRELPRHAEVEQRHRHACGTRPGTTRSRRGTSCARWSPRGARFLGRSDVTLGFFGVVTLRALGSDRPRSADQPRQARAVQVGRRSRLDPAVVAGAVAALRPRHPRRQRRRQQLPRHLAAHHRCARTGSPTARSSCSGRSTPTARACSSAPARWRWRPQPDSNAFKIQAQLVF